MFGEQKKVGTKTPPEIVDKEKLFGEIRNALAETADRQVALREVVRLLHENHDHFDWTGIYLLDGDSLILSEFLGAPTVHKRIPVGEGICGAAVREKAILNIPDVNADPRYLACSVETKSELVVPIMQGERVFGEIDIDSHRSAAFGPEDEAFLLKVADLLADFLQGKKGMEESW